MHSNGQWLSQDGNGQLQPGWAGHQAGDGDDQVTGKAPGAGFAEPRHPVTERRGLFAPRALPAGQTGVDGDRHAHRHLVARAVFDHPNYLVAQGGRPVGDPGAAAQHVEVRAAHPGPRHSDQGLTRGRGGQFPSAQAQIQVLVE